MDTVVYFLVVAMASYFVIVGLGLTTIMAMKSYKDGDYWFCAGCAALWLFMFVMMADAVVN